MKKFLLSLGAVMLGTLAASAATYTVFDITAPGEWTGDGNGYTRAADANGFTITTAKGDATQDLRKPSDEKYSMRVYKGSSLTIESSNVDMKCILITYDNTSNNQYVKELVLSTGWSGALTDYYYLLNNEAGSKTFTATAEAAQVRIKKIEVSDTANGITVPGGDEPVNPGEAVSVKSVKEAIAAGDGAKIKVDFPLTIAFKSYSNIFAVDEAGDFIQVYGKNSYEITDVIPAGWEGTYTVYSGATPEIVPAGELPASTEKKEYKAKVVAAKDVTTALVNSVIYVANVEFAEATPDAKENFTGVSDGVELSFRNNYTIAGVPAGKYDVKLVVTIYKDAPSLYVIQYDEAGSASAGINGVAVDENAPAVYYNLQGVKVAEPENGLYIRVQGNKATKVMLGK